MIPIAAIIVAVLCMATSCPNEEEVEDLKYIFKEKFDLYPEQKTYNLGDTIWIEYNNPSKTFFDTISAQPVNVDTVQYSLSFYYRKKFTGPTNPPQGFCSYVLSAGLNGQTTTTDHQTALGLNFGCQDSTYKFKIGVVPRYAGIYSLDLGSGYFYRCPARQSDFPHSYLLYCFDVLDANIDVYQTIPAADRRDSFSVWRRIQNKEIYVFQVQ